MKAKDFVMIADCFRYSRPHVPDITDPQYRERSDMYRQWLDDISVMGIQLGRKYPAFKPMVWYDYIHGIGGPKGGKVVRRTDG
jgi:hypothetical protein